MAAAAAALAACASSGPKSPDENPALVAAVQATPRVVAGETTWVTPGAGYEIVARTRRDIADVDSGVARESAVYQQLFGQPPARVIVAVRRIGPGRSADGFAAGPPLPPGELTPVVEAAIFDASSRGGAGGRGDSGGGFPGSAGPDAATARVMRAWLSARATALTGRPPTQGATGLIDDPRVPGWAEALVPALGADDGAVDRLAVALSAPDVGLFPVDEFFSMTPPAPAYARGAAAGGGAAPGAEGRGGGDGRG
ncbi:MAG: hypothetical protein KGN74_07780, partial [Gemmatimonadota bacterium]|nr:hypothetical protein [Gemmatimonadota bacterium]